MPESESIGLWTEIKLQIIRKYAAAYTTILKEQRWCKGYAYIDAFAGPGEFTSKETPNRIVKGSPVNALEIQNKFSEYHFIDIDPGKIDHLKQLTAQKHRATNIHFHIGDANEILQKAIIPHFQWDSCKRALCILDPYGADAEWATTEAIGRAKTMDALINFPLMGINRNAALKRLEASNPSEGARLTKIWGDESWKKLAYVEQQGLFETSELIKKGDANETLKRGFAVRLKDTARFEYVPNPILMRNSKNGPLYYLFFASHKPVAQNIIRDIFKQWGGT
ncbi:MAG TPA: three-Cys-motif partner protein TcmP [Candidatus Acidoferrales bacterium]|nr:three-Cys-motif partner protein TcmP [Candidatus Acidoferrales bacterium]